MFAHNKRLQYSVRVGQCNPGLANMMLEQFGGRDGELAAAMRYFSQSLAEDDPGRKDMLLDIATEELSHLEIIGTVVAMLNKGAKGKLAEGVEEQAELYREMRDSGAGSQQTQILYGGGPALRDSGGSPWTATYLDSTGDPTCDLRSDIAAEVRAKIVYERLINLCDDPDVRDTLGFLMTREIAHQKSFEKALYSIQPNFPVGKLPGKPEFTDVYVNASQGEGDMRGPWNSDENFRYVSTPEEFLGMGGSDGAPSVQLSDSEREALQNLQQRTRSNLQGNPRTGVELGSDGSTQRM